MEHRLTDEFTANVVANELSYNLDANHVTNVDPEQLESYGRSHTFADIGKPDNIAYSAICRSHWSSPDDITTTVYDIFAISSTGDKHSDAVPDAVSHCNADRTANYWTFSGRSGLYFAGRDDGFSDIGQHGRHHHRGCAAGLLSARVHSGSQLPKEEECASCLESADFVHESAV